MAVFSHPMFDQHEQIVFCQEPSSGLKAIIAIHDTRLGPAVGGCRMWPYASDDEALTDVLRLSRGMTYKNALAGLPFGGGKAVILGDPAQDKSPALWRAYGRFLNSLGGRYITAEDVGTSPADMDQLLSVTEYVTGLAHKSGDPSPYTALGVFEGIKACVHHRLGRDDLNEVRVAVQGLGHVGFALCRLLHRAGARLYVSDLAPTTVANAVREFGAVSVAAEAIYDLDVDVYAPCALGATINDDTLPRLKVAIVAGSANNQLAEPRHDALLRQKGILYAPDYVINAGGIINVSFERHYDAARARSRICQIHQTLLSLFKEADDSGQPTGAVADRMARRLLGQADGQHVTPAA